MHTKKQRSWSFVGSAQRYYDVTREITFIVRNACLDDGAYNTFWWPDHWSVLILILSRRASSDIGKSNIKLDRGMRVVRLWVVDGESEELIRLIWVAAVVYPLQIMKHLRPTFLPYTNVVGSTEIYTWTSITKRQEEAHGRPCKGWTMSKRIEPKGNPQKENNQGE